jgi:predicted lipoprotein with Yx(FWY)xxD motif
MQRFPHFLTLSLATLMLSGPVTAASYGQSDKVVIPSGTSVIRGDGMASMHHGPRMTTVDGMSLYVFDKDSAGMSNCYGKCAVEWPPMKASSRSIPSADFSVIRRTDGTRQWAWKGHPLYLFDEDKVAGDVNGDGYSPDWHIATAM